MKRTAAACSSDSANTESKQTRTIRVGGRDFLLERRVCQGGCQKDFWVTEDSKTFFARSDCQLTCNLPIDQIPAHILQKFDSYPEADIESVSLEPLLAKKKPKTQISFSNKKKTAPLPLEIKVEKIDFQERRWITAVSRARRVFKLKDKFHRYREMIVDISLAVITNKKKYSIKKFSIAVGIDRKTLQCWIKVKHQVIDRIENYDGDFIAAKRVRNRIRVEVIESIALVYAEERQKCLKMRRDQAKRYLLGCNRHKVKSLAKHREESRYSRGSLSLTKLKKRA